MDELYQQLVPNITKYRQEHLLRFYKELSNEARKRLLQQIESIDLDYLQRLYEGIRQTKKISGALSPIEAFDWGNYTEEEKQHFTALGWSRLREGKVAAFVVAGGQGSRLGHPGPKGTFSIGLPSGKSLFQLQAERLLHLAGKSGRSIPWYIMTSPANHEETLRFFHDHDYFGYSPKDLFFFPQAVLPAVDEHGRILMSSKEELALAPSGNGEAFASLSQSGALQDMKRRGIEWVFYYNVDNALIKVADPVFVGVAAHYDHPIATKVTRKAHPEEKVGIVCLREGKPAVVEYTDVPEELIHRKDQTGRLHYDLGNISIHLFRLDYIEQHASTRVPYHAAHKKIASINEQGILVEPARPNAFKFERFIFDFFPLAESMTVLLMDREEEFAPVKNKEGEDSAATARELLLALHRKWLEQAGIDTSKLTDVEISPLVSYAGEGLG